MDAMAADVDTDGDLDLLLNAGDGTFADASDRLPDATRDSEDVGIADFDSDGDLDIVIVTEDDAVNEFSLNTAADRSPTPATAGPSRAPRTPSS